MNDAFFAGTPSTGTRYAVHGAPGAQSRFLASVALVLAFALPGFGQAVKVDEKADQVAALKIELEQARQARDRVIAKRWEDKARDTEAREKFNQEYDELKNKLELKVQEADRLHAEIQNYLRDAEEAQARAEEERVRFLGLASSLRDKARDLAGPLENSFPARVPERLQTLNRVLKSADTRREAPGEILADLMAFERSELALTREISVERREFLRATKEPGRGVYVRLGTVTAAYRDDSTKRVGLLLKNPPDQSFTPFDWKEQLPVDVAGDLDRALTAVSNESAPVVLIPVDVLLTQNLSKAYTQAKDKGFWRTIYETLETGGVFMLPLGAILITLIVMFTQKLRQLRRARKGHREQDTAAAKAEQGDAGAVREIQGRNPENLSLRVVEAIASRREAGRVEAEKAAKEVLVREVPRLERGLTTLAVLAAAAPMLGLLGTISGLVAMFQVITEMGVNDPKMLAGGIGEALVSTEAGLLIAIPALLGHNYLANRVDDLIADAEYRATRTLNVLWPKG